MKNKKIVIAVLVLAVVGGMIGAFWLKNRQLQAQPITSAQQTRFLMDTSVEIRASGPDAEAAVSAAFAEMARVEQLFSRHIETSDIARINNADGIWVEVAPEVISLLEKAIHYSNLSGGTFDITIGALLDLWNFGGGNNRVPTPAEINQALALIDYTVLEIDSNTSQVRIPKGMVLDLGGIAKGYAVDRASAVLKQTGVISGMIYAGGDITTIGAKSDGSPWRVGVQHPRISTQLIGILEMADSSIVTSGDYERYFTADGVRYHHILNPHTGYPAQGLISVTIYGSNAADADALSTAIFVLGWERGQDLIENLPGYEAVMMDSSGNIWVSSGLKDKIQLL